MALIKSADNTSDVSNCNPTAVTPKLIRFIRAVDVFHQTVTPKLPIN